MAHMVETMAYSGEVPWHGLGRKVGPNLSPDEMLKEAGLDWEVEKVPAFYIDPLTNQQMPTGMSALLRKTDSKLLTNVPLDNWNPCQNRDAMAIFDDVVKMGHMEMHTAGSLKGGKHVWALAKTKESFRVFRDDLVEQYFLFSNPHEYGKTILLGATAIRVVCNNTISLALNAGNAKNMMRINHRRKFNVEEVKALLGFSFNSLMEYKEAAEFLGSKSFKNESIKEYFTELFPFTSGNDNERTRDLSKNAAMAFRTLENQPGTEFAHGTWWHAFNTVTFMVDHLLARQADTRVYNAWFGSGKTLKEEALSLALEKAAA